MSVGAQVAACQIPSTHKPTSLAEHLAALKAIAALQTAVAPAAAPDSSEKPDDKFADVSQDKSEEASEEGSGTDPDSPLEDDDDSEPSVEQTAVARCRQIYCDTLAVGRDTGVSFHERKSNADHSYRCAMPALAGRRNIAAFIACVAQGMLFKIFNDSEGARLLYAAQVAFITSRTPLSAPNPPLQTRRIHRKKSNIAS